MKGIDVSCYQGNIDWKKAKADGVEFAILKIINKSNVRDSKFEQNWNGCEEAGVIIQGVYNYSYATTTAKAKQDANCLVRALNGRKTMVWLDVEDKCQMGLKSRLIDIIVAYKDVIEKAGLQFGVYTGLSFYNSYIKPYIGGLNIPFWIARYGTNNGSMNMKNQPQVKNMWGWQYTSKGKINGIAGYVDVNEWYVDMQYIDANTSVYNGYNEPERLLYYRQPIIIKGDDVKWVQERLIRNNCLAAVNEKGKSNIDGKYGPVTRDAVLKFQELKKLELKDGKVGSVTKSYLKQ